MSENEAREKRVEWLRSLDKQALAAVAAACCTTAEYIRQISHFYGGRRPSVAMAKLLAEHTGLPRAAWRPDVW